jgi:hypothetical protein
LEVMTEPVGGASETGRQARTRIGEIPSAPPDATKRSWRSWFVCASVRLCICSSVHLFVCACVRLSICSYPACVRIQADVASKLPVSRRSPTRAALPTACQLSVGGWAELVRPLWHNQGSCRCCSRGAIAEWCSLGRMKRGQSAGQPRPGCSAENTRAARD